MLTVILFLSIWIESAKALTDPSLDSRVFYPFGIDDGDVTYRSWGLAIEEFPVFNKSMTQIEVGTSGRIFCSYRTIPRPDCRCMDYMTSFLISPFICNVNDIYRSNFGDEIFFRYTRERNLLNRATQDVRKVFSSKGLNSFQAKWIFVATWRNVTCYSGIDAITPTNTFQTVLITDGNSSIAMFNYGQLHATRTALSIYASFGMPASTQAQAGFWTPISHRPYVNYSLPGSGTPAIRRLADSSNTGLNGRWMFRIDGPTVEEGSSSCRWESLDTGKCELYQILNETTGLCYDVAPAFDCPVLEGPVVIDRQWVEFYCVVPSRPTVDLTDDSQSERQPALFNVTFLFDDEPGPSFLIAAAEGKATLQEKYLYKKLGKTISCRVFSLWSNGTASDVYSRPMTSRGYWAGIRATTHAVSVQEGDPNPAILTIISTIPITCIQEEGNNLTVEEPTACNLSLKIISLMQPGRESKTLFRRKNCELIFREEDWNAEKKEVRTMEETIEIFSKIDATNGPPTLDIIQVQTKEISERKDVNGHSYKYMWHNTKHSISVYHHDVPMGVCRSTGDPNLTTFGRLFYSVYGSGQYIYMRTTRGTQIEIQVRHRPCWPQAKVSCVCGVAVREEQMILAADMCNSYHIKFFRYNTNSTDSIISDPRGYFFEISTPSGVKVVSYVWWHMNIEIYVTAKEFRRTEGLCGSHDYVRESGIKVKDTDQIVSVDDQTLLATAVESWRVPLGKSLFDNVISERKDEKRVSTSDDASFCICDESAKHCGRTKQIDNNNLNFNGGKPKEKIIPKDPLKKQQSTTKYDEPPPNRRKKRSTDHPRTDDIDSEYDSSAFNYSMPEPTVLRFTWPTTSGITEANATAHCRRVLWDESSVKSICESLVNASDVDGIINKCVSDIKISDDLRWADDKIPEIQNLCIFEAITTNYTDRNETNNSSSSAIDDILKIVEQLSNLVCIPQDCSGNGRCTNGTCVCHPGFLEPDCSVRENAPPKIIKKLGPSACDVDIHPCRSVRMLTENVINLPTLTCKIRVRKDNRMQRSLLTKASFESRQTTICELPVGVVVSGFHDLTPTDDNASNATKRDFYFLHPGNPVSHYTISISNNGRMFSRAPLDMVVYDSRCFQCEEDQTCYQKRNTCLINGYCFAGEDRNPFNPDFEFCDPTQYSDKWTKSSDKIFVVLIACMTALVIIVAVVVVFLLIQCRRPVYRL